MKPLHWLVMTAACTLLWACTTPTARPITVRTQRNPAAPVRESPTYAVVCSSTDLQRLLIANPAPRDALHAKLQALGYVRTEQPDEASYVIWIESGLSERHVTSLPATEETNPHSVRFKNVAAMLPGGRYEQLLQDKPDDPGEILIGPQGELVGTGRLEKAVRDFEDEQKIEVRERTEYLLLQVWDVSEGLTREQACLVWEVVATGPVAGTPSATLDLFSVATNSIRER